jgi:hypothetical protein
LDGGKGGGGIDWIDQAQVVGSCEYADEPSGSLKRGEFVERFRTFWLLKKDCAPWKLVSQLVLFSDVCLTNFMLQVSMKSLQLFS